VIENVGDLPPGTLGFRASGTLSSDEYREMIDPIYAASEARSSTSTSSWQMTSTVSTGVLCCKT
jgi:hypothetical protein